MGAAVTLMGCGDSGGRDTGSGGVTAATTAAETGTGGGEPSRRACELYLECMAEVAPMGLAAAVAAHGPEGSCWGADAATNDLCIMACANAREDLRNIHPDEPTCHSCEADSHCGDAVCNEGICDDGTYDNVMACDTLQDELVACDPVYSGNLMCALYEDTPCDIERYFDCLRINYGDCVDGMFPYIADQAAFDMCLSLTVC